MWESDFPSQKTTSVEIMKILIAGGTGFIGRALIEKLHKKGDQICLLTRGRKKAELLEKSATVLEWDGISLGPWIESLHDLDAIINLSGESIGASRWTDAFKKRIIESRINSTTTLLEAARKLHSKPRTFINASAVGYYGDIPDGEVTESSPPGDDFLAHTCIRWERAVAEAESIEMRTVMMRTGFVIGSQSPAFKKMILPFRFFAGGAYGSGRQWFPWIHLDDVVNAYIFALERSELRGPTNVVAPGILTVREFCKSLGKVLHRPCWAPIPSFVLKTVLGEMSDLLLKGQRAVPKKLLDLGFVFKYPHADEAIQNAVG